MNNKDEITNFISSSLQILLIKYPTRTGLGVVLGYFLAFLTNIFTPILIRIEFVNLQNAPIWGWISAGMLVMHIPTIRSAVTQHSVGDSQIDKVLDLIDTSNFTETEKRKHRRDLISQVAKNVGLSTENSKSHKRSTKVTSVHIKNKQLIDDE